MFNLSINGRYLTHAITGVERTAHNLISAAVDVLRASGRPFDIRHYVPRNATIVCPPPEGTQIVRAGRLRGHVWEQLELSRLRGDTLLFSPCNTGPVLAKRHIVMVYDAQVFTKPQSYSFAFRSLYQIVQPAELRHADRALTISWHSRDQLEQLGVSPKGKLEVVHLGGDHMLKVAPDEAVLDRESLRGQPFFLVIGSRNAHKNLPMAVEAIRRARSPHSLIIAGGGSPGVFAEAGIPSDEMIRPIGRITDGEMRALFEAATALLFPSLEEGFGLPPLEAMTCGCPVIVSTAGAIPEVCGDGALYAAPTDADGWASQIDALIEQDGLRATMIEKGRERAAELTWARAGRQFVDVIDGLAASRTN